MAANGRFLEPKEPPAANWLKICKFSRALAQCYRHCKAWGLEPPFRAQGVGLGQLVGRGSALAWRGELAGFGPRGLRHGGRGIHVLWLWFQGLFRIEVSAITGPSPFARIA